MQETTFDTVPYTELKKRRGDEFQAFSALNCFYAFSNEQFGEGIERLKLAEGEKVVRTGTGMFCRKGAVPELTDMLKRHACEVADAMRDPAFARGAFLYEMGDHEYCINWQGDWDVCGCFGECEYEEDKTGPDYLLEMGYPPETVGAYLDARREHVRTAEGNGWL